MTFPLDRNVLAMLALMLFAAPVLAEDTKENKNIKDSDAKEEVEKEKAATPDPSMFIRMQQDKFLQGVPMDIAFIDIYVLGTKVSIPLDSINGVRLGDEDGKGTIAMKDGEILNGRIEIPELRLSVDWGQAIINRASLKSIDRSRDLHWQQKSTPNGVKWFLAPKSIPTNSYVPASTMTRSTIQNYKNVTVWNR